MKNNKQRLLAFNKAQPIDHDALKDVMAGGSIEPTGNGTYQNGSFDGSFDVHTD